LSFLRVASISEIPTERGLRVRVGDIDIGLYRVGEQIHAMEDTCPHAGFPLSRGHFEGCVVTCDAHGWPFDVRTGFDPKQSDGFPIPCFAVRVVDDEVEVDVDVQINSPRELRRQRASGTSDGLD
jgi:nitrite reductase/ring-hydroxylating ferredoxin subunit